MREAVVHALQSPTHDLYIGREHARLGGASDWANPFGLRKGSSAEERDDVLRRFAMFLADSPELRKGIRSLRGKQLGCWCRPKHRCHGDLLAQLAARPAVAVVGSRGFPFRDAVTRSVRLLSGTGAIVVSGGARGVDAWAAEAARTSGVGVDEFPAPWDQLGRRAGFVRNTWLVDRADAVVAFWDGESRGTQHTISIADKAGIPTLVVTAEMVEAKQVREAVTDLTQRVLPDVQREAGKVQIVDADYVCEWFPGLFGAA